MLTDFQNSFTGRLNGKFATKSNFTIHHTRNTVSTLPCEIWMSENWQQSEKCIVINAKSQGSEAEHLRNDVLLYYTFVTQSSSERILKIGETFGKVTGKMVIVLSAQFALHFCHQRCWSRQISWITCVLQTETVTIHCYVNKRINVSLLSTNIKLL